MNKNEKQRFEVAKSMHTLICSLNDEGAYMEWIYLVPDGCTEEDLMWFAEDGNKKEFAELVRLFNKLWNTYSEGGVYVGGGVY